MGDGSRCSFVKNPMSCQQKQMVCSILGYTNDHSHAWRSGHAISPVLMSIGNGYTYNHKEKSMFGSIKIGACDWALPGNGLYATQIAADLGLEAISIKLGLYVNDYPLTRPAMQKIYLSEQQRYGIEYAAIALNDFDNIPMHARENTKEHAIVWDMLKRAVPTAAALGVPIIQVPSFVASEMKTTEDMEYSAKALQYLCDGAADRGISVALETDMAPERFEQVNQIVDRKNFYLYFDSQNYYLNKGYDPRMILERQYPQMCSQLHVKDGVELSGGYLGSGPSGFFATMDWLAEHGFSGILLLENYYDVLPMRTLGEDPYEIAKEDIRILKKAVQERS